MTLQKNLKIKHETVTIIHTEFFKQNAAHWILFKSHVTCLYCLCCKLKHVLNCEHVICDIYVKIFEQSNVSNELFYTLSNCILCVIKKWFQAILKFFITDSCILSIDDSSV